MQIAIPVLLSAAVSLIVTLQTKKLDISFDYKKYIIERRKTAYIDLEIFLSLINTSRTLAVVDDNKLAAHTVFLDSDEENPFHAFFDSFANTISKHKIWYSPTMYLLATKFASEFADGINEKTFFLDSDKIRRIAVELFPLLETYREQLERQFLIDLKQMNNVSNFLKVAFEHRNVLSKT